jgi:hypothetical protein
MGESVVAREQQTIGRIGHEVRGAGAHATMMIRMLIPMMIRMTVRMIRMDRADRQRRGAIVASR